MIRFGRGTRRRACLAVLAALLSGALVAGSAISSPAEPGRIMDGVVLDGLSLGGKTPAEAEALIRAVAERKLQMPLLLRAGTRTARRTPRELGATCDVAAAVAAATAASEDSSAFERLQARLPFVGGRRIGLPLQLDARRCEERLKRIARSWAAPPREPRLRWVSGPAGGLSQPQVIPGRPGYRLDAPASRAHLEAVLAATNWQEAAANSVGAEETLGAWQRGVTPLPVEMVLPARSPRITDADVRALTTELTRFSTRFRAGEKNRAHNIRLACRAIDGVILLPGDVFSYNETVGHRTRRAGFRLAPQIVDGELVPGIGGGVCQVSTTVYNAALLADLQIVRRNHHQFPVHYVPAGRDATVADGSLDLRFRNRLSRPVALHVTAEGSRVVARVFGAPECRREVTLQRTGIRFVPARTVRVTDRSLRPGRRVVERPARRGQRVTLIRVTRDPNGLTRRETISRDLYRPENGVIRIGARPAPRRPKPEQEPVPQAPSVVPTASAPAP
jgi:vancomycin resistance protein YoaR